MAAIIAVSALGAADGGYFPSDWGLATLGFALVAATVVLVTDAERPSRLELAFLGGLAALAVWAALSSFWSPGAAAPVLESERGILYVAAAAAALLLLSSREASAGLLGGVVAGAVLVSLYALGTRLFPGHVGGAYDPSSGYQLAEPIGYWNALGLLTALAILLALGFAAHGGHVATRALAGVALVVLVPTLYFSFSRGALVALAGGAVVQAVLDPRRARLLVSGLAVSLPAALGVLEASRSHALTAAGATLQTAQAEGSHLTRRLVVLAVVAAAAPVVLHLVERRLRLPPRAGTILVASVVVAAAVVAAGVLIAAGGPLAVIERGADAFTEPLPAGEGDLQRRLLSVSGNGRGDYWHVALEMARDEPLLGAGAGSFEAHWLRDRPVSFYARDAHNLYLESLAELGPLGLALLLATLALPLAALPQARGLACGPAAAGAFVAYLLHAAVDWDWEMPAVTLLALFCGAALLASRRPAERSRLAGRRRFLALALTAPVLAVALVAHVGNRATAASIAAIERGEPDRALAHARRAIDWAPWSDEPWQLRGEAELLLEDDAAARRSLARALELNAESWSTWLDLAVASHGAQRARALAEVKRLNPLSSEADELQTEP
jgi:O-antigen ligase/polysaccharide polymerase Wzy-like membrane protein